MPQEMQQRNVIGAIAQIAVAIELAVETGMRLAVLFPALDQVMLERVHARERHIRILPEVMRRIEFLDRADTPGLAQAQEVAEAQFAGRHAMPDAIPGRIEPSDRPPSLGFAPARIMQQRIDRRLPHIVIAVDVIAGIEVGIGIAPFFPAPAMEMGQRIAAGFGKVGMLLQKPGFIEKSGLPQQQKLPQIERRRP